MKALHTKKPIEQYLLQKGQIILPTQLIYDCVSEKPKVQKEARLLTQLITRCYHDKTKFRVNNNTIFIEKGEYLTSYRYLSKHLGFTHTTIKTLTKELVEQRLIGTRIFKKHTIFAVLHLDLLTHFPSYKNKRKRSFEEEQEKRAIEHDRNIDRDLEYFF